MSLNGKHIVVVGMGPAGLMAGTRLLELGYSVSFYDHKKAAGRKFLVAGHGGFNLTHSEDFELFNTRYSDLSIENALNLFTRDNWIDFLNKSIKIQTFTGSSGKVFPSKEIKPITVLYNWLNYIQHLGGQLYYEHQLIDFENDCVTFKTNTEKIKVNADYVVFALGGGSWSITGSTGEWLSLFTNKGVTTKPFESFNSGYELTDWEKNKSLAGGIVKNIVIKLGDFQKEGDIVFTDYGIEGTPIYWSNQAYRNSSRDQQLTLDLKPTLNLSEIETVLAKAKNISDGFKKLKLSKTIINYFKINLSKEEYTNVNYVSQLIKSLSLTIKDLRPIDDVISTSGGIEKDAINENFSLLNYPNVFCCGEMLNWNAPTGGYLIQGCVSSGYFVANEIAKLNQRL